MSRLKRTYKNISNNKKSGNHSNSWAFYSIMESIFGEKAWIASASTHASIASSDSPSFSGSSSLSEKSIDEKINRSKPKKRRVINFELFITDIKENKQKERKNREKRRAAKIAEKENKWKQIRQEQWEMHKDRMQCQQSLIEILTKIVERK
ncbi:hypothetical protein P5V15_005905 [Pogonomyrmex californicus]